MQQTSGLDQPQPALLPPGQYHCRSSRSLLSASASSCSVDGSPQCELNRQPDWYSFHHARRSVSSACKYVYIYDASLTTLRRRLSSYPSYYLLHSQLLPGGEPEPSPPPSPLCSPPPSLSPHPLP